MFEFMADCEINKINILKLIQLPVLLYHNLALLHQNIDYYDLNKKL